MSDQPEYDGVTQTVDATVSDTPPAIPPVRKPTAHQIATETAAALDALVIRVEQLAAGGGTATLPQGDQLSSEDRELIAQLPGLAADYRATRAELADLNGAHARIGDDVRDFAETVERVRRDVAGLLREVEQRPYSATGEVVELSTPVPKVFGQVLDVMRMVTELGKDSRVSGSGGNYKYRSIDAAMDAVGTAMRQVGVILSTKVLDVVPTTNVLREKVKIQNQPDEYRDRIWTTVRAHVAYTFVSPNDGSTHTVEMVGEGRDLGDKATSKAVAMAFKYALLHGLCIPIEGLPESDGHNPVMEQQREDRPPVSSAPPAQESQVLPTLTREQKIQRVVDGLNKVDGLSRPAAAELLGQIHAYVTEHNLWHEKIVNEGGYPIRALYQTKRATQVNKETVPENPPAADSFDGREQAEREQLGGHIEQELGSQDQYR